MIEKRVCPRCKKVYTERPAMSRIDNAPICPLCGYREALDNAKIHGIMSEAQVEEIYNAIKEAHLGRAE